MTQMAAEEGTSQGNRPANLLVVFGGVFPGDDRRIGMALDAKKNAELSCQRNIGRRLDQSVLAISACSSILRAIPLLDRHSNECLPSYPYVIRVFIRG